MNGIGIIGIVTAVAIVAAALIIGGRFTVQSVGRTAIIVDRFNGDIRACDLDGFTTACRRMGD